MTREDVIRLAQEVGFDICVEHIGGPAYIQVPLHHWDESTALFEAFAAKVAAAEREACAKTCEELAKKPMTGVLHSWDCAAVIRSRGGKT